MRQLGCGGLGLRGREEFQSPFRCKVLDSPTSVLHPSRRSGRLAGIEQLTGIDMRTLLIGIDSGTQSTKALVVDTRDGKVLATASQAYDLIPGLPPGAKEQHPHTWREAAASAMRQALRQAKASAAEVRAIGVSGQQHGFVPLDQAGEVIRPAKLWCDTSTAAECEEITAKLGGPKGAIRAIGNAVLPG